MLRPCLHVCVWKTSLLFLQIFLQYSGDEVKLWLLTYWAVHPQFYCWILWALYVFTWSRALVGNKTPPFQVRSNINTCSEIYFLIYILRFTHSFLHHKKTHFKILMANHSSEMAFSHVCKAFRQIRRDLSTHTTAFIQQVQVLCVQTSIARKLCVPKVQKYLYF